MVPKKFLKWKKVFGKVELERMLTRKVWDHAIDLKETFKPQKGRIYPLSKNKREEVQNFVEDQLRKGYIRPSGDCRAVINPFGSKVRRRWVNKIIFTQGLSFRTCFFVLGLISSTTQGAEILEDYNWMSLSSPLRCLSA